MYRSEKHNRIHDNSLADISNSKYRRDSINMEKSKVGSPEWSYQSLARKESEFRESLEIMDYHIEESWEELTRINAGVFDQDYSQSTKINLLAEKVSEIREKIIKKLHPDSFKHFFLKQEHNFLTEFNKVKNREMEAFLELFSDGRYRKAKSSSKDSKLQKFFSFEDQTESKQQRLLEGIKRTLKKNKEYLTMINQDLEVVDRELVKAREKLIDRLEGLSNIRGVVLEYNMAIPGIQEMKSKVQACNLSYGIRLNAAFKKMIKEIYSIEKDWMDRCENQAVSGKSDRKSEIRQLKQIAQTLISTKESLETWVMFVYELERLHFNENFLFKKKELLNKCLSDLKTQPENKNADSGLSRKNSVKDIKRSLVVSTPRKSVQLQRNSLSVSKCLTYSPGSEISNELICLLIETNQLSTSYMLDLRRIFEESILIRQKVLLDSLIELIGKERLSELNYLINQLKEKIDIMSQEQKGLKNQMIFYRNKLNATLLQRKIAAVYCLLYTRMATSVGGGDLLISGTEESLKESSRRILQKLGKGVEISISDGNQMKDFGLEESQFSIRRVLRVDLDQGVLEINGDFSSGFQGISYKDRLMKLDQMLEESLQCDSLNSSLTIPLADLLPPVIRGTRLTLSFFEGVDSLGIPQMKRIEAVISSKSDRDEFNEFLSLLLLPHE